MKINYLYTKINFISLFSILIKIKTNSFEIMIKNRNSDDKNRKLKFKNT
jgi:hypothetical protein